MYYLESDWSSEKRRLPCSRTVVRVVVRMSPNTYDLGFPQAGLKEHIILQLPDCLRTVTPSISSSSCSALAYQVLQYQLARSTGNGRRVAAERACITASRTPPQHHRSQHRRQSTTQLPLDHRLPNGRHSQPFGIPGPSRSQNRTTTKTKKRRKNTNVIDDSEPTSAPCLPTSTSPLQPRLQTTTSTASSS